MCLPAKDRVCRHDGHGGLTSWMSDPMMAISIMIQSTYLGTAGYTFLHT